MLIKILCLQNIFLSLLDQKLELFLFKAFYKLATIKLVDYLVTNKDENLTPCAICLHLSKAFQSLNFEILINLFKFHGIIGTPLKLLDNYLRTGHEFVSFKNINFGFTRNLN